MKVILDTEAKTITVPWNYAAKLEEMNKLIASVTDDPSKQKTFSGYVDECWRAAMADTKERIIVAAKPIKKKKAKAEDGA